MLIGGGLGLIVLSGLNEVLLWSPEGSMLIGGGLGLNVLSGPYDVLLWSPEGSVLIGGGLGPRNPMAQICRVPEGRMKVVQRQTAHLSNRILVRHCSPSVSSAHPYFLQPRSTPPIAPR